MPVPISPFTDSGLDTEGTIKKLIDIKRKPIIRKQEEITNLQREKAAWKDVKFLLKKLDSSVDKLYGFNRVFRKRKVYSEDENFIKATVEDNTSKGDHTIEINQLAAAHKITTDKIPIDKKLGGAVFTIRIGEDEVKIKGFEKGGTINKLTEVLENEANKLIKVQKIRIDKDNVILSIESRKTGKNNKINIKGSNKFFEELGLTKIEKPISLKYDFNDKKPETLQFYEKGFKNSPALFLQSGKRSALSIGKKLVQGMIEFVSKTIKPEKKDISGKTLTQKSKSKVQIKDITIFGADMPLNDMIITPSDKEKEGAFIEINDKENNKIRIDLKAEDDWAIHKSELKEFNSIQAINFINNSSVNYLIDELKISDQADEKMSFKNIAQEPTDAEIKINGITMTRERNNNLDDIIDGITLNLMKKTRDPLKIDIKEDTEKIENSLNSFISNYNDVIIYITAVNRTSTEGRPGKPAPAKDIGILMGDNTLKTLHSKLRSTIFSLYPTSFKEKLSVVGQIGISTGEWSKGWKGNKRKGLLVLNKEKYKAALNAFGDKISEVFGYDSDNNKLIDTGAGWTLSEIIKPFYLGAGIISQKEKTTDNMIKSKSEIVAREKDKLVEYEDKQRINFLKMERSLDFLKRSQERLDNQMRSLPSSPSKPKED